MAQEQPPGGGGRLFKKALADAQKPEKQRRASTSRSGVPYPPLFSAALRRAVGLGGERRKALLNLRRRHGVADAPAGQALVEGADGETAEDSIKNLVNGSLPGALASVGDAFDKLADEEETGDAAIKNSAVGNKDASASGAKKTAGDYDAHTAPSAGDDTIKNRAYITLPGAPASLGGAFAKNDYIALAAGGHASKKHPAGDYRGTGAVAAGDRGVLAASCAPLPDEGWPNDEAEQKAKNKAVAEEMMRDWAEKYGLLLPKSPPPSSSPPPPPPLELREATPPPPSYPPPPVVQVFTVRNQVDARTAYDAWKRRGINAVVVQVPEDVPPLDLDRIWNVLRPASLSIFKNPERISDKLSIGK